MSTKVSNYQKCYELSTYKLLGNQMVCICDCIATNVHTMWFFSQIVVVAKAGCYGYMFGCQGGKKFGRPKYYLVMVQVGRMYLKCA